MKDKILKHYWFSKSTDEALKTCKKTSKFRTEREYVEQLILDDFERQQRGQTTPESSQVIDLLNLLVSLIKPTLEHTFITQRLSYFNAVHLLTDFDKTDLEGAKSQVSEFMERSKEKFNSEVKI
ncbi:MAG: hypothetical protein RBS43_07010 [Candidatus Cloacimonas sp.]|jgi:predicted trehalose synthase|nr:hypothetical protein [Candidatus Cloacimonas sp.]